MKRLSIIALVLIVAFATVAYAQSQGYIVFTQGAKQLLVKDGGEVEVQSGGELNVESGGELDIESGGALQWGGSAFAPDALTQITAATVLTTQELYGYYYAYPIDAKYIVTLPAATAGLERNFFVGDSDSLLITTASADTLLFGITKVKTATTVAGTVNFKAIDSKFWVVQSSTGTWTNY